MTNLDLKSVEKDGEELDEDYFRTLTKSMVTHNVKKRVFSESFTDDDADSSSEHLDGAYSPTDASSPKKRKKDEYHDNISASASFVELEQERRLLHTELERVRWSVMTGR